MKCPRELYNLIYDILKVPFEQNHSFLPTEHLRFSDEVPDVSSQHRVHGIASRAAQDADDLTAASRRHDREFLRGINAKLVSESK